MITKEKFIAAIVQTNRDYFYVYLVEKKSPDQRKYIYGNFQETLHKEYKNKTKLEVLASLKEEMWEIAQEEVKPKTMKDYYILGTENYSFLGTFTPSQSKKEGKMK